MCSAVVFPHLNHQKIIGCVRKKRNVTVTLVSTETERKNSNRPVLFIAYFIVAGYLKINICIILQLLLFGCNSDTLMLNNMITSQLTAHILTSSYLEQNPSTLTALHQLTPYKNALIKKSCTKQRREKSMIMLSLEMRLCQNSLGCLW